MQYEAARSPECLVDFAQSLSGHQYNAHNAFWCQATGSGAGKQALPGLKVEAGPCWAGAAASSRAESRQNASMSDSSACTSSSGNKSCRDFNSISSSAYTTTQKMLVSSVAALLATYSKVHCNISLNRYDTGLVLSLDFATHLRFTKSTKAEEASCCRWGATVQAGPLLSASVLPDSPSIQTAIAHNHLMCVGYHLSCTHYDTGHEKTI